MAAQAPADNADQDFASMMAKHHQDAIDMARMEPEHGRDPEMRRTAQETVQKQQHGISEMRNGLSRQPDRSARPRP